MKKRLAPMLLIFAILLGLLPRVFAAETSIASAGDYVSGDVIVCVRGGVSALLAESGQKGSGTLFAKAPASFVVKEVLAAFDEGTQEPSAWLLSGKAQSSQTEVLLLHGKNTDALLKTLSDMNCVTAAQPNYLCKPLGLTDGTEEPFYPEEWYLNNICNDHNGTNSDLNIPQTWSVLDGDLSLTGEEEPVVVAVLDTGVDYRHTDLMPVMWDEGLNYPELTALGGGKYGINTRIDETHPSDDPMDDLIGHGTHCASVIAAACNDAGCVGIAPNVRIMACRWLSATGKTSDYLKALQYVITAKKAGVNVRVANNSWGVNNVAGMHSPVLAAMIEEAGKAGILTCFAAGNEKQDLNSYTNLVPPKSPYLILVGASDSAGTLAPFSNYGNRIVDVFAPGVNILAGVGKNTIEFAPKYYPWLQSADDTIFFENAEGGTSRVALRAVHGDLSLPPDDGNDAVIGKHSMHQSVDNHALCLTAEIAEGERFCVDISVTLTEEEKTAFLAAEEIYYAYRCDFDNCDEATQRMYQIETWDSTEQGWQLQFGYESQIMDQNCSYVSKLLYAEGEPLDGNVFRIRITCNTPEDHTRTVGFYLDDFGIGTKTVPYSYESGTSMATPAVCGVASLIFTQLLASEERKNLSDEALVREVSERIKGGTVLTDELAPYSIFGIVDAEASCAGKLHPVIEDLADNGDGTLTVTGRFPTEAETVEIEGVSCTVTEQTDRSVTVETDPGGNTQKRLAEVRVTCTDGTWGRNFCELGNSTGGFTPLGTPGAFFSSMIMAAADDTLLAIGFREETGNNDAAAWRYDISQGIWSPAELPFTAEQSIMGAGGASVSFSMAGGEDEIYFLYMDYSFPSRQHLATYDVRTGKWISDVPLDTGISAEGAILAVYNGELLLIGGVGRTAVSKIYPDTGKVYGTLPDLPPEETAAGKAMQIGEDLVIPFSINDYMEFYFAAIFTSKEEPYYNQTRRYSAAEGKWTESEQTFWPQTDKPSAYLDANSSVHASFVPIKDGVLAFGPTGNNGGKNMTDVWAYSVSNGAWSPYSERLDVLQMRNTAAAEWNGTVYVLGTRGTRGLEERFCSLNLGDAGAPNPVNAKKATDQPARLRKVTAQDGAAVWHFELDTDLPTDTRVWIAAYNTDRRLSHFHLCTEDEILAAREEEGTTLDLPDTACGRIFLLDAAYRPQWEAIGY